MLQPLGQQELGRAGLAHVTCVPLTQEKAKLLETVKDDDKAKRITGKAWFMQDRSEVATEVRATLGGGVVQAPALGCVIT